MPQTITYPVALGDEVKDRVTGFTGIVVALYSFFNRCQRANVQPKATDDNSKVPIAEVFDVEQLDIITPSKIQQKEDRGDANPNGPMPNPVRHAPIRER